MKKSIFVVCLVILMTMTFGIIAGAAANKSTHLVGLHDRLLPFEEGNARVINNNLMVPLGDIAKYLYIDIAKENNQMFTRKSGTEFTYDYTSKQTFKDGVKLGWSPFIEVDGKLFVGVKYIAEQYGFQVEYFQKLKTLRIYRDSYKSMSHTEFEKFVQKQLSKVAEPKRPEKANVYLTFDDGPAATTTVNIATLKKYGVHGTFFFVGKQMTAFPAIVKATEKEGHSIGAHSMTHIKGMYKSAQSLINEMDSAAKMINQITGQNTKIIRAPYGSTLVTTAMKNQLKKSGYKMWDWDVDSNDWRYKTSQYEQIVKNVRLGVDKSYQSGDRDIIVLLHDRQQTNKALPHIIEWLQKEGYTIKKYDPAHHIVQNFHHDSAL